MGGECVFCRIANGREPNEILRWWPDAVAFEPLGPVVPGHVLIVPRCHVGDALEDPMVTAMVFARAAEWAKEHTASANLITSAGAAATQTVLHLHIHVVPRTAGDGLKLPWTKEQ